MISKLLPRLLGVFAVHAAMGAIFWLIVKFALVTQNGLAFELTERLDGDPNRVQAHIEEVIGEVLRTGFGALLASTILACLWLWLVERAPPVGDQMALKKRGSWAGLMLVSVIITIALFWFMLIGAPVAEMLSPSVPMNAALSALALQVLGYWLSTGIFAPPSTKIAVPGASLFG